MLEYSINIRPDGSAVIARDKWNKAEDYAEQITKPFLFETGQKVVDIFSNVVTIKNIYKYPPSKPGCCPEWNVSVLENRNTYRHTEIAGIFVREVSKEELAEIMAGIHIETYTSPEGKELITFDRPNKAVVTRLKELMRMYGESPTTNFHEIKAALEHMIGFVNGFKKNQHRDPYS